MEVIEITTPFVRVRVISPHGLECVRDRNVVFYRICSCADKQQVDRRTKRCQGDYREASKGGQRLGKFATCHVSRI